METAVEFCGYTYCLWVIVQIMDKETAGRFLEYYWSLSEDVGKRHKEKLQKIGLDIDSYLLQELKNLNILTNICLLYTSDAADE